MFTHLGREKFLPNSSHGSACSARHQDRSALLQKRFVYLASLSPQSQLNAWDFRLTNGRSGMFA